MRLFNDKYHPQLNKDIMAVGKRSSIIMVIMAIMASDIAWRRVPTPTTESRKMMSILLTCSLVTLTNLQKNWFEFHLRSSPSACSGYGWSVDRLITSLLATPCWRDPARLKQLSTVAILGSQFELYHFVVPLSFLRSISLASLFSCLSIFGWSDLLQFLRKPAAFSFAVLCIIVFIHAMVNWHLSKQGIRLPEWRDHIEGLRWDLT